MHRQYGDEVGEESYWHAGPSEARATDDVDDMGKIGLEICDTCFTG